MFADNNALDQFPLVECLNTRIQEVLTKLNNSPFPLHLTGSTFFGFSNPRDIDFIMGVVDKTKTTNPRKVIVDEDALLESIHRLLAIDCEMDVMMAYNRNSGLCYAAPHKGLPNKNGSLRGVYSWNNLIHVQVYSGKMYELQVQARNMILQSPKLMRILSELRKNKVANYQIIVNFWEDVRTACDISPDSIMKRYAPFIVGDL